ncbi:MAG: FHA domain-containing protein [Anaerolineae bacterium]|nr:FHA domain-containing protein [Anaerolineae bacterium]
MALICPVCRHENEPGTVYCAQCNAPLPQDDHTPIVNARDLIDQVKAHQRTTEGLGLYGAPATVTLYVEDDESPLRVSLLHETTLGRKGPPGEPGPDVDLSPYDALDKGVSRIHAIIQNHGNILTLTDLGSTNGTSLNGERLNPQKPRIIKSRDEIRLGRLVMRIEFEE